jgi:tetratricopeptide (TPR) repeat protein
MEPVMRVDAMLAAAAMLLLPGPSVAAVTGDAPRAAASYYIRARAADAAGMLDQAAKGYAAALAAAPDDEVLALRAYRQALLAGDASLARRAAAVLDAKHVLPPDARLLILADAVRAKDWATANAAIDAVDKDDVFTFLVPVLRGWTAFGAGDKDGLAKLAMPGRGGTLAIAYSGEHRALMLIALGQTKEGIAAVQAISGTSAARAVRVRMAAAATLAGQGKRDEAMSLLIGKDRMIVAARALLEKEGKLPGAVDTASRGIAELLVRVAVDINRERATPLGLSLARLSTFLAPDNSETWLATAEMLALADHADAALTALGQIPADDPAAEPVRLARLQLLVRKGEQQEALTEARAAAVRPGATLADLMRVGDLLTDLEKPREAADAYTRALAVAEGDPELADQRWTVRMLRGGALDAAGDWAAARADLEAAVKLAPNQAVALNYLGYAQLERRENLAAAEKLIERASALQPDDAAITDSLGWTYFLRGDIARAIPTLERAVAGQPAEPTINEHLGDAYWTAGRRYEARYAWRAALVYADDKVAGRIRSKLDGGLSTESAAP